MPFLIISLILLSIKIYYTGKIFVIEDEAYYRFWSDHLSWGYPEHPPMVAWIIALSKDFFPNTGFFRYWDIRFPGILFSIIIFFLAYDWGKRLENSETTLSKKFYLPSLSFLSQTGIVYATLMTGIPYYFGSFFLITPDTPLVFFFFLTLYFYYRGIFENSSFFYFGGVSLGLGMLSKLNIILPALGLVVFFLTSPLTRQHFHPSRLRAFWSSQDLEDRLYLNRLAISLTMALFVFLPYIFWNINNDFPVLNNLGRLMYQNSNLFSFFRFWSEQTLLYFPLLLPILIIFPFATIINSIRKGTKGYLFSSQIDLAYEKKYFLALMSVIPLLYFFYKSTQANLRINWLGCTLLGSTALLSLWISQTIKKWGKKWSYPFIVILLLITLSLGTVFYITGNKFQPLRSFEKKILRVYPKYKIFQDSYLVYDFFNNDLADYYRKEMRKELPIVSPNYQLPSLINYYVRPEVEAFGEANRVHYHLMTYYFLTDMDYSKNLHKAYYLLVDKDQEPDQSVLKWQEHSLAPRKLKTFYTTESNWGRSYDLYIVE